MNSKNFFLVFLLLFFIGCSSPGWRVIVKPTHVQDAISEAIRVGVRLGYTPEFVDKDQGILLLRKGKQSMNLSIRIERSGNEYNVIGKDMSFIPDPFLISSDVKEIVQAMDKCCGTR